jgi:hypothetical protein
VLKLFTSPPPFFFWGGGSTDYKKLIYSSKTESQLGLFQAVGWVGGCRSSISIASWS